MKQKATFSGIESPFPPMSICPGVRGRSLAAPWRGGGGVVLPPAAWHGSAPETHSSDPGLVSAEHGRWCHAYTLTVPEPSLCAAYVDASTSLHTRVIPGKWVPLTDEQAEPWQEDVGCAASAQYAAWSGFRPGQ